MTFVNFSVIRDAREWRYFKMLNNVTTPVEEQLFSTGATSDQPQIFLRPKESVHIPFRFLTFRADHSVSDQAPSDPYRPFSQSAALSDKNNVIERLESRNVKVIAYFLFCYCTYTTFHLQKLGTNYFAFCINNQNEHIGRFFLHMESKAHNGLFNACMYIISVIQFKIVEYVIMIWHSFAVAQTVSMNLFNNTCLLKFQSTMYYYCVFSLSHCVKYSRF